MDIKKRILLLSITVSSIFMVSPNKNQKQTNRRITIQAPWTKTHIPWSTNVTYEKNEDYYTFIKKNLECISYNNTSRGFILVPGLGDVPFLMGPLEHSKLMPTNHWHTVHFHDARTQQTFSSSFGQDCEILSVLKTIKAIHPYYESLAIMAESRGGAAAVNTIAILAQPNHQLLQQADILEKERRTILRKLRKGCIVLRVPLISLEDAITCHTNDVLGKVIHFLVAPLVTGFKYSAQGKQAIDSLDFWYKARIPTLVCFASRDLTLGNNLNTEFIEKLEQKNGTEYTWNYTFTGDHIKSGDLQYEQLLPYFFTYRTLDGFEYNPKKQLVYKWIETE